MVSDFALKPDRLTKKPLDCTLVGFGAISLFTLIKAKRPRKVPHHHERGRCCKTGIVSSSSSCEKSNLNIDLLNCSMSVYSLLVSAAVLFVACGFYFLRISSFAPDNLSEMGHKYKLVYFDGRGRAELVRWEFAYAGVDFEDKRIAHSEWPSVKATTPFGQLPYLEVDGKPLPQSMAIARFVARKNGLTGKDDWEAAQADAIVDYLGDALKPMSALYGEKDEAKKNTLKETFLKEQIVPYLAGLERKLKESEGKEYFVGSKPTWADFAVVVALDNIVGMESTILDSYPGLKAHSQRVHELKGIKEWIAKRPNTPF